MRKLTKLTLTVIVAVLFAWQANAQQTAKVTSAGTNYLEYLPKDYNSNTNKYPIVISLHGIGEKGNTASEVWRVANVSLAKYIKYGQEYPFIVISPQLKTSYGTWPPAYVMEVINHVKKYLRVNNQKVYLTGLSLGGYGVWKTAGAYPDAFAAIVPVCSGGNDLGNACKIAASNLPVWAFHGDADTRVSYTVTTKMVNAINSCSPKPNPLAKVTIFPGLNHSIWDKVYKETNALNWMLTYTNGTTSTGTTPTNAPPSVSAGGDKTITLPTNYVYLQGSASDTDGSIASYQWTKLSGGSASLSGATSAKVKAYNLVQGTYYFRLTVRDNDGASKYDDVKVTVNGSTTTTNKLPVVSAGADKSTTSMTGWTIIGSASDPDGYIVSYKWTKVSGGSVSMYNAGTPKLFIKNYSGSYIFRLTATDNKGGVRYDDMIFTTGSTSSTEPVDEPQSTTPTSGNKPPEAYAGTDKTTTNNGFTLVGKATDSDGSIASVAWTKISGPSISMKNANTLKAWIYNLVAGTYVFRFIAKDNDGAVSYDDMKLIVSSTTSSNKPPAVYAGNDKYTDRNGFTLVSKATDEDGTIASYLWKKISGGAVSMANATTPKLWVYNLLKGTYVFRVIAEDNDGATDYDDVKLVVQ